jgi:hypothetical protein
MRGKERAMSIILVAVLIIGGLVSAVVVTIGIPVLVGLMAYDVFESRDLAPAAVPADAEHRIQLERGFARGFVIAGGLFWAVATFAGLHIFGDTGVAAAMLGAFFPLVATLATLVIGWYYERFAAVLLVVASFAAVVWGVSASFEMGVWIIMTIALIGPMMTAATLFWMARREQEALEFSLAARGELELASINSSDGPQY